jgi:hypothetical protein
MEIDVTHRRPGAREFLSTLQRQEPLCGPQRLLVNEYRGALSPGEKRQRGVAPFERYPINTGGCASTGLPTVLDGQEVIP